MLDHYNLRGCGASGLPVTNSSHVPRVPRVRLMIVHPRGPLGRRCAIQGA